MSHKKNPLGLGRAYRLSIDELYEEANALLAGDFLVPVRSVPGNENIDMQVILFGDLSIPFAEQTPESVLNYHAEKGGFTLQEGG